MAVGTANLMVVASRIQGRKDGLSRVASFLFFCQLAAENRISEKRRRVKGKKAGRLLRFFQCMLSFSVAKERLASPGERLL